MKTQNNAIAFALLLSTAAIYSNENQETRLTEKQEQVAQAVATAIVHGVATTIDQAIDAAQPAKKVTLEQARQLLQTVLDNLEEDATFELNDVRYVVVAHKTIVTEEETTTNEITPADAE
jgi:hypothetical protein